MTGPGKGLDGRGRLAAALDACPDTFDNMTHGELADHILAWLENHPPKGLNAAAGRAVRHALDGDPSGMRSTATRR